MTELLEKITEGLQRLSVEDGFQIMEELPCCHDCAIYEMADLGLQVDDPYCFYHNRDLSTAGPEPREIYLSWGASTQDALRIVARMEEAGLEASWDGVPGHRVHVRDKT